MARGSIGPKFSNGVQDVEFDLLRRRGFQPPWERF